MSETEGVESLRKAIEDALFEHDATWLGDWAGGTTCRRCGPIETSTDAHRASVAASAALAWMREREGVVLRPSVSAEQVDAAAQAQHHYLVHDAKTCDHMGCMGADGTDREVLRVALASLGIDVREAPGE